MKKALLLTAAVSACSVVSVASMEHVALEIEDPASMVKWWTENGGQGAARPTEAWVTEGFEAFRRGTFGNAGQNLYVSKAGVLQRIYQYDLDRNGYFDLVFANCQNHHESAPSYVYSLDGKRVATLPAQGARSGLVADLNGDGIQDIVIAGFWNLLVPFPAADVYYGQPDGSYNENCRIRLQAPRATDCACGRFDAEGKVSIAFAMPHFKIVRIYQQSEIGFEWAKFTDLKIDADLITTGDFDSDGFDDLACRKEKSTATTVYWGSANGFDVACKTEVPEVPAAEFMEPAMKVGFESELEEKFPASRLIDTVEWNGKKCFTLMTGLKCVFFAADKNRAVSRALELPAPMGISATTGDFNADGIVDVAIASHAKDANDGTFQNSWIWLNSKDGFKEENRIAVKTKSASSVNAMGNMVVFGQCAADGLYTNDALLFSFSNGKFNPEPRRFEGEDAQRVHLFRDARGDTRLFLQNHFARRCDGYDKTYVYWGRNGGYSPDDMTPVPSWCAVDSVSADLDDDGWIELIVCNNSENSLHLDPGHHVHHFGPKGFDPSKSYTLKTDIGWGAMVADFNRDGYLDVFTVCDHWNGLAMFNGGPDGLKRTYDCMLFPPTGEDLDRAASQMTERVHLKRMNIGGIRWPIAVDLNNDGWLDVAVPVGKERSYVLWGGPAGFDSARKQDFAAYECTGVRTADLDKNGWPDLIFGGHVSWASGLKPDSQPHSSYVNVYWNGPDGLSESRKCILRADAASNMCVGDLNGDGWLDIFAGSYQSEVNRDIPSFIYWNRKGRFAIADRQDLVTHSVSGCFAADFNQDGHVDLAVANHKVFGDHTGYSEVWWNGAEGFMPSRTTKLPTCGPHGMSAIEPGNQLTRGPEEYYYSEPYLADRDMAVKGAEVVADCPPKTWVKLLVRSAVTRDALESAEWCEPAGVRVAKGGFLQYRLEIGATLSLSTPRVTKVEIQFGK